MSSQDLENVEGVKTRESTLEISPPEKKVEAKAAAVPTGHIETHRGAMDGFPRTFFKNGAETRVERLNVPGFIETVNSDMRATDQAKAAEAGKNMADDDDGRAVETIEEQLQKGRVEGSLVFVLSDVFRSFGKDIFTIPEGGFDPAQMGHEVSFQNKAKFVIPESRAAQMQSLLRNTPTTLGESSASFHIKPKDTIGAEHGFEAVYTYKTPDGQEITADIMFLYGKEKFDEVPEEATAEKPTETVAPTPPDDEEEYPLAA